MQSTNWNPNTKIFIITNRGLTPLIYHTDPFTNIRAGSFDFDLRNNSPSNSIDFLVKKEDGLFLIPFQEFQEEIGKIKAPHLLFFIHGYSQLPEDVIARVERLQALFDQMKKDFVEVIPIIWPCDNDIGKIKDYWDDKRSAEMSAFSFCRGLEKLINSSEKCNKILHILAHSMGNRVLKETFNLFIHYFHNNPDVNIDPIISLFKNIFMVAGDIIPFGCHSEIYTALSLLASKIFITYAHDDRALKVSKILNNTQKRLGKDEIEDYILCGSETGDFQFKKINCSEFNNKYDPFWGHTYFLEDENGKAGKLFLRIYSEIENKGKIYASI